MSETEAGAAKRKVGMVSMSLMLFSMFFGAGNLIFPPMLAASAGTNFTPAFSGFLMGAVGLPVIAMLAVAVKGSDVLDLSARGGKAFAIIFSAACYLSIGALYALPRTGAVSFLTAAQPVFGWHSTTASVLFNLVFFGVGLALSINPNTLVDKLGKVMTPALLVLLVVLVWLSVSRLEGQTLAPADAFAEHPLAQGLLAGYTTMDSIASLAFGIIIISSLRYRGVTSRRELLTKTSLAGVSAGGLLAVIYIGLGMVGRSMPNPRSYSDGAAMIADAANLTMGFPGRIVLGVIVLLACMTTAVGLLASTSEFFHRLMPGISYRVWLFIFAISSFVIASAGLSTVLGFAGPIIGFLYPVAITVVACTLLDPLLHSVTLLWGFRLSVWTAVVWSGMVTAADTWQVGALQQAVAWAPLHGAGMGWIVPTAVMLLIGLGIDLTRRTQAADAGERHTTMVSSGDEQLGRSS